MIENYLIGALLGGSILAVIFGILIYKFNQRLKKIEDAMEDLE